MPTQKALDSRAIKTIKEMISMYAHVMMTLGIE
jgi:hypothetical protein